MIFSDPFSSIIPELSDFAWLILILIPGIPKNPIISQISRKFQAYNKPAAES